MVQWSWRTCRGDFHHGASRAKGPGYFGCCHGEGQHIGRFKWRELSENQLGVSGWIQGTGYTGGGGLRIFVPNAEAPFCGVRSLPTVPHRLAWVPDTLRLERATSFQALTFVHPRWHPKATMASSHEIRETNVPFGLDLDHDFIGKHRVVGHARPMSVGGASNTSEGPASPG